MRTKLLFLWCFCLLCGSTAMALDTDDSFTISTAELTPNGEGGDICITVGLNGSRQYTAFNLDITLPAGVDVYGEDGDYWVIMDEDEGVFPFTRKAGKKTFTHSISYTYGVIGERVLRVACSSNSNENFTANSGNLFQIYLVASPYAKPGINTIKVSGCNLTAIEGGVANKYVPANQDYDVLTIGNTSTVDLNISAANQYSTCVLPFDYEPSGFQAFTANSVNGDYLVLNEAKEMAAYTPYIIYSTTGYTGTPSGTVDASKYEATPAGGDLYGAIEPQKVTQGYILQNQGDGAMFYKVNNQTFPVPAGKCWLEVPASVSESFGFQTPSSVKDLSADNMSGAQVYDLNGRRVSSPKVGNIYVIGNKKVLKIK